MNVKFILTSVFATALLFVCMGASNDDFLTESASAHEISAVQNPISQDGGEKKGKKFGDFLNKIKGAVEGVKELNIIGTWSYTGTDLKFSGDNAMSNVGGQLAAKRVEQGIDKQLNKLGIQPGRYVLTFNDNGTYSALVNKRTIEGEYTYNKETKTILMTSLRGMRKSEMSVEMIGNEMSLLYDSSKFLDVIKGITGSVTKNSSLKIFDTVLQSCKGMHVGMKFQKQK